MSLAQEILQPELPLAASTFQYLAIFSGAAAIAGAAVHARKITNMMHHTVNEGEVGVLMHRGKTVTKDNLTRRSWLRKEQIDLVLSGEFNDSEYVILPPDYYKIAPFYKIEPVYVSHNQNDISLKTDIDEQLIVPAALTWEVIQDSDNPVRAITNIKHIKQTKKEKDDKQEEDKRDLLKEQVIAIVTTALGDVLHDKSADHLRKLDRGGRVLIGEQAIEASREELAYYGVRIPGGHLRIQRIHRIGEEVLGQYIEKTKNPDIGAVAAAAYSSAETTDEGLAGVRRLHSLPGGGDTAA